LRWIYPSSFLVTKQNLDSGFARYEIRERFDEEGESRFEVNAICGEDHIVLVRDGRRKWVTPGMKRRWNGKMEG
jgi:hypothetical protein